MHTFPCGCKIPGKSADSFEFDFDLNVMNLNCSAVWDMLGEGHTKGVFQLESPLARQWTKEMKPRSIEHLAALVAIVRPGCLESIDEHGISTTKHFVLRLNGLEETPKVHPLVDELLADTFGLIIYQEQAIRIAVKLANFSGQEADNLRKSLGKKKADLMAKCRELFLTKAKEAAIIPLELAEQLFVSIEAGQRYAFNKSHAVSYAFRTYQTAYEKAHGYSQSCANNLFFSKLKKMGAKEEIFDVVSEGNLLGLEFFPPDITQGYPHAIWEEEKVYLGASNIKGMSSAVVDNLLAMISSQSKPIGDFTWVEFLVSFGDVSGKSRLSDLASVGYFDKLKGFPGRRKAIEEISVWDSLSDVPRKWCKEHFSEYSTFLELLKGVCRLRKEGGGMVQQKQVDSFSSKIALYESPPSPIVDNPDWIVWQEDALLGVALTVNPLDGIDSHSANCTIKDFLLGKGGPKDQLIIKCEIRALRITTTKKGDNPGQEMAVLSAFDGRNVLENVVVFPEAYSKYKDSIYEGAQVLIEGNRSKSGSFSVTRVSQI